MSIINNKEEKYLYKYLPFNQYSLQLLINQKFYLSPPDLLNDPFEGDFIISNYSDLYNEDTFKSLLDKRKKDVNEWIDNHYKETILNNWRLNERDFQMYLYEYLSKSIKRKFGTTSFSRNCNSIDMWSHYADSHKGFVLVFDKILLSSQYDILNSIFEVEYDSMPEVRVDSKNFSIVDDTVLFKKKLPSWKKEKEVRIIQKHWSEDGYEFDFSRLLRFPLNSILGVIYGSKMSFENVLTIDYLLCQINLKHIKSYYAMKNHKRNKIMFNEFK